MRSLTLDDFIDRYEAALATRDWRSVSVTDFTPPESTSEYWPTLVELLRVRMEHAAERDESELGQPSEIIDWDVNACLTQFPKLQQHPEYLSDLAYEEYRLKRTAGHRVTPLEYRERLNIDIDSWSTTLPKHLSTSVSVASAGKNSPRPHSLIRSSQGQAHSSIHSPAQSSATAADVSSSAQRTTERTAPTEFAPGETLGSFRILCAIGSGALARVYLAQQLDLSERAVVLKVSSQATLEPQKIALLQHPNIVQIFSVHDLLGYQVLCMPYAGATTLADFVLQRHDQEPSVTAENATGTALRPRSQQLVTTLTNRQRAVQTLIDDSQGATGSHARVQLNHGLQWPERWNKMSFEEIVCELLLQVARGLAHAHRFGIVHSDLKPANILVGDDGQARLVDFNVSQEMAKADRHLLGGTLPYMAPEHLQSLLEDRWLAGPSSDLYSLGIIAFQLLSRRLPFEATTGSLQQVLMHSIAQRTTQQFDYRLTSHEVSVDMRSIIDRLIQPEVDRRYESAAALCEDLERHLDHHPLKHAPNRSVKERARKWARRHPRLSSAASVGMAAAICFVAILLTTWAYRNQWRREQATQLIQAFRSQFPTALVHAVSYRHYDGLVSAATDACEQLLATLHAPRSATPAAAIQFLNSEEQAEIAAALSRLDESLNSSAMTPQGKTSQSTFPDEIRAVSHQTQNLLAKIHGPQTAITSSRSIASAEFDELQSALLEFTRGETKRSIETLCKLVEAAPQHYAAWLLLGTVYNQAHQSELADAALGRAVSLMPDQWQGWFYRGLIAHGSAHTSGRKDQYQSAATYFTRALQLKPDFADALLNRALCYEQLGDTDSALSDIEHLIKLKQFPLRANLIASRLNQRRGQTQQAKDYLQFALSCQPVSAQDFVYRGTLRLSQDRAAAIDDFRRASQLDPEDPEVCQSLAVLVMELEPNAQEAAQVLDRWVSVTGGSSLALASRGVQHARSGQVELALADAEQALKASPKPRERAQIASIFVMLAAQAKPEEARAFQSRGLTLLAEALQLEWRLIAEIKNDPDMSSLRDDPRFQSLIQVVTRFGQLPALMQKSTTAGGQP